MTLQRRIPDTTAHSMPGRSLRGRLSSGAPNPVDVHVGRRLRLRRIMVGMSQEQLAEAIGVTFQQIQKYERGANRISASRLWDLSVMLNCPVSFFYKEMDDDVACASPRNISRGSFNETAPEVVPQTESDVVVNRETLNLLRAYHSIRDVHVRRRICDLTKSLAAVGDDDVMVNGSRPEEQRLDTTVQ
jgi:transcriptional regulator with XRE-family HTH domain